MGTGPDAAGLHKGPEQLLVLMRVAGVNDTQSPLGTQLQVWPVPFSMSASSPIKRKPALLPASRGFNQRLVSVQCQEILGCTLQHCQRFALDASRK